MAHELTIRKNKKAEMAYVGETPWHGLGQALDAGADLDQWRIAAGMDWKISRSRVRYGEGDNQKIFDDKHVLFRSDTKDPLSIVSPGYKIVQPGEVLEFFKDLVGNNGFELNTAGTLFGGKRFWGLAKVGETATVAGRDEVGGYLLLSTSCDGSLATTARFTTVRVVCNNTLSMAVSKKQATCVTINHRSTFRAADVKADLGIARDAFKTFMDGARLLASTTIDIKLAEQFTAELLRDTGTVLKDDVRKSKQFNTVMNLYTGQGLGSKLEGTFGTLWGLTNAVTEFVDHRARATSDSHRLASAWFGRGDELKTEAFAKALAIAA